MSTGFSGGEAMGDIGVGERLERKSISAGGLQALRRLQIDQAEP
jgi:hypothetical protein